MKKACWTINSWVPHFWEKTQIILVLSIIYCFKNCTRSWSLPSQKTRTCLWFIMFKQLGCWWPAYANSRHGFDLVFLEYSNLRTLKVNTLRLRQYGRHFTEFVPNVPIKNIPSLMQIMAWHWPADKPLSEPMIVVLATHICIIRPPMSQLRLQRLKGILDQHLISHWSDTFACNQCLTDVGLMTLY